MILTFHMTQVQPSEYVDSKQVCVGLCDGELYKHLLYTSLLTTQRENVRNFRARLLFFDIPLLCMDFSSRHNYV